MDKDLFQYKRKSHIKLGEIYFWTASIHNWISLLSDDRHKDVIIGSLDYLSKKEKIDVFAFVVMPNHIHLIWRINEDNGKESAHASFLKFTAHEFRKSLILRNSSLLNKFAVAANNKDHEFWQRDSLAIPLYSKKVALQKLDYIHWNPLADHRDLTSDPCNYAYSSASYYELNDNRFGFLKNLLDEF